MLRPLWNFVGNGKNRDIVSWLGGGSVVMVAGIWAAFTHFFPHVDKNAGGSTPIVITQSGSGIASGRDTVVNAQVAIGLDEKQVGRRVAEAQQPLTDQLEKLAAQVAREKGVGIAPLRAILRKLGEAGVADEDVPRRLDDKADELIKLREEIAQLRSGAPTIEFASFAQLAQGLIDKGDLDATRAVLAFVDHYRRTGDSTSKLAELNAAALDLMAAASRFMARGDSANAAQTLISLGDIHRMQGRWEPALAAYRMAETFARQAADRALLARALRSQARVESSQRDYGKAREHAEEALGLSRGLTDKKLLGDLLLVLAEIRVKLADLSGGADSVNQAIIIADERGDDELRFYALLERADIWTMGSCDAFPPSNDCLQKIELSQRDYTQAREAATRLGWAGLVREMDGFISRNEQRAQIVRSVLDSQSLPGSPSR
jgi:tetratricopeptide (TPR) repeat protein